jgi:hypothetical protein
VVEAIALGIAINLASTLLVAGGRRLGEEALGDEQEQALQDAFARATAAMLVEIARYADLDRNLPGRLEEQFGNFFEDRWVAETLVDSALRSRTLPVDELRRRYEALGLDPGALPMSFERAMNVFAFELATRLRDSARSGGPLAGVVMVADIEAMRDMLKELVRTRGATGPDVDELWRESRARCAERWRRLGLPREEAFELADDLLVGAPSPRARSALRRPLTIVTGEVGAGKSLLLDRLFQRAIVRLREDPEAPLPAFVEAREVEGLLQDALVRKTSSLGNPRNQGAAVFLDGAEEAGRAAAVRLLREARILAETWPNTTVVVAGRPLPDFVEQEETFVVPELDTSEQEALIERLSGQEVTLSFTYSWPESVKEAVKRPLFTTLQALDLRTRDIRNPRSTGELLSGLVERAFGSAGETVDTGVLMRLAAACVDRGGPVRAADVATTAERAHLRETGLVLERGGAARISLQILTEWFAAQALESGLVDPEQLASDFARLERWRYPLVIAVGTFGYARVEQIIGPIVRSAPAFASQAAEEGLARGAFSDGVVASSPEEVGQQMRAAMSRWVEGIGPLAPLIAPVREDGSLSTLGLRIATGRVHGWSWYRGDADLGEVISLVEYLPDMQPNREWPRIKASIKGVDKHRQPAWTWRYTLEDLRSDLSKLLKKRRLPLSGGLLVEEVAWDAARELRKRFDRGNYRERDPISLEAVEGYLDLVGWDTDAVTFGDQWGQHGRDYELKYLRDRIHGLREAGEVELSPPWPMYDRMPGDPGYIATGRGSAYLWEWYSPEALLERVRIVLEGALEGYNRFVRELFPRLASHMLIAATLPARLTGTLILDLRGGQPDVSPYVAWYLEPLPPESENELTVEIGRERASREHMLGVLRRTQYLRPEAAAWISSPEYADSEFFGKTPATELAYEWLWDDLKRVSWVDGWFNRRFS